MAVSEGVRWCTACADTGKNCWMEQAALANKENCPDNNPVQDYLAVSEGQGIISGKGQCGEGVGPEKSLFWVGLTETVLSGPEWNGGIQEKSLFLREDGLLLGFAREASVTC
jgi:hypothetical protein